MLIPVMDVSISLISERKGRAMYMGVIIIKSIEGIRMLKELEHKTMML